MENEIIQYIVSEALVLMPVLFIFGLLLKNTPKVADWTIPWVLLVVGVVGGYRDRCRASSLPALRY
ncbi:phage holin family protein [Paenibacillus sp. LHD-117]|uniref:phage holin family protein n=1 Tax=Paenibacillus sp. LHD-117 TaxID=3071412 RepID=UPI0027E0A63D|nr:phage holin family protein [Paenibacillus sp. LHD-117]MDQ6419924.1 phage holin family protein [Paenibacillus sp. LHD-117]